ncbi:MAG: shikimate kinase [Desulfosarcina sp.]|nr:shikimate kinase [Desulfosarcina sp.]MBC2744208.1 shikimate kinase [Desulfosarcina sp.]MBC2767117.1 shikimate kinase [Desulfosarcina sp.]
MNLFLIGYRCTGKTTVGKALAQRLGWPFMDTDRMIVETTGTSIARMVDENGWPFFREQERQALASVSAGDRQVVATGGGIILDDRNISAMKKSGTVVWLTASEKIIAERMLDDDATAGNRPSLTGEITSLLSERRPFYEKAANFAIDTNQEKIAAICDRIIEKLER